MGVMAGFCSSDLVYGNRGLSGNGAALLQYNGLRPLENKQMAASARNPSGSFASSSECHSLHHCCIGLRRNAKATRCKERLKSRFAAHIQTRCMHVGHPVHSSGRSRCEHTLAQKSGRSTHQENPTCLRKIDSFRETYVCGSPDERTGLFSHRNHHLMI